MLISILYIFLAILGLSFLIFIHELGHYFTAKWVGMRVEVFSIGFGKPIISWKHKGVEWKIGWIPFGGYVKIAGTDTDQDPYQIKDGFFAKSPWDRIKVLAMGPIVNILFALLAFSLLYALGGREKRFSEFTNKIGWVDPHSELFQKGVRPGDEILSYDGQTLTSAKEHTTFPMMLGDNLVVKGNHILYENQEKIPFSYRVSSYSHPLSLEKGLKTAGVISPAEYIIYDRLPNGTANLLPPGSPSEESGIQYGDRIIWVNGERIFSLSHLEKVLNDNKVLVTVKRGDETLLYRVPRVFVDEIKPNPEFKEELIDWQFEAELNRTKIQDLYTLPYNLTNDTIVEGPLLLIDEENQEVTFPSHPFSSYEEPLNSGDKIIGINGIPVKFSYQLLYEIQKPKALMIVQRKEQKGPIVSTEQANLEFEKDISSNHLENIVSSIGGNNMIRKSGNLVLLHPVVPKKLQEFSLDPEKKEEIKEQWLEQKRNLEAIEDPEKRQTALSLFEKKENQLYLGLPYVQDRTVQYNPNPFELFWIVLDEVLRTLKALVTGNLNPKWISGPIGIVQFVHQSSMISLKESLFWLGAISLNLGILNLLPIPVLDGGGICIALFEMITRKKVHPKTLEKLIIPFAILLILLFVFLTFNDVSRIVEKFIPKRWPW